MREFAYQRAHDVPGAVALLGTVPDARFLGGGTNLVDLMKTGVERPALLVDVRQLPLGEIELTEDGGLRIGATVTNSDVAAHPEVRRRYPALAQAVLAGASGQLRNIGPTVGGPATCPKRVRSPGCRTPGAGCSPASGKAPAGSAGRTATLGPACAARATGCSAPARLPPPSRRVPSRPLRRSPRRRTARTPSGSPPRTSVPARGPH
ncbi:hypothetical protein SSPIM334S_01761 [Streptomyces spiroverticillatus]